MGAMVLTCNTEHWQCDLQGRYATLYLSGEVGKKMLIEDLPQEVLQVLITEKYIVWED